MKRIYKETKIMTVDSRSPIARGESKNWKVVQMEKLEEGQVIVECHRGDYSMFAKEPKLTLIEGEEDNMNKVKEISKEQIRETLEAYMKTIVNMQEVMEEIGISGQNEHIKIKERGFEVVTGYDAKIPTRATALSAGYDIAVLEGATIEPKGTKIFNTGIKAFMAEDEVLEIHIRSSMGIKKKCILTNCTGIIDADYYNNEDNEGHIKIAITNMGDEAVEINAGQRVAQGIFKEYLQATNEEITEERIRTGGIGSTEK